MDIDLTGLVLPERVEMTETADDGRTARFVVDPLERGFGHTLGNSVRRALLSSLRGSAVWAFRIDGVVHEHQTVQGVVEDVHQIIRALKSLVLTMDEDVDEAVLARHKVRVISLGDEMAVVECKGSAVAGLRAEAAVAWARRSAAKRPHGPAPMTIGGEGGGAGEGGGCGG